MFNFIKNLFKKKKPIKIKLGLALGSGGAKGFAHIGALQAFSEEGLDFDYVSGTSIGSIVGAFYAMGKYSATDLRLMFEGIDYGEIINFPFLKMNANNMKDYLSLQLGDITFEELKKPFRVIATDYQKEEAVVFSSGDVATALTASSCYIPFFKPFEVDGKTYIDGAFCNSVPSDEVKKLGADVVVGIDLSAYKRPIPFYEQFISINSFKINDDPSKIGYDNADVMLRPDLSAFSPIDFKKGDLMYELGYEEAKKLIPEIKQKIENLKEQRK